MLPKVCAGEAFLGIATTEPGGGSDIVGATRTRAVAEGDEWVLNGEKMYISGVRESQSMGGIHLTLARTADTGDHKGFTFIAVPLRDEETGETTPGIMPTLIEDMGRMGISTGGFAMEDVRLPGHYRGGRGESRLLSRDGGLFGSARAHWRDLRWGDRGRARDGHRVDQGAQGLWSPVGLL